MSESKITIESIPAPETIRAQIADHLQQAKLLKQLLRVSERAKKLRQCEQEAAQ